jgi:hypothetical protein
VHTYVKWHEWIVEQNPLWKAFGTAATPFRRKIVNLPERVGCTGSICQYGSARK